MNISLILILIFISAIYILILKDFRTVTLRTDTTDTPTHRDASHLKIAIDNDFDPIEAPPGPYKVQPDVPGIIS